MFKCLTAETLSLIGLILQSNEFSVYVWSTTFLVKCHCTVLSVGYRAYGELVHSPQFYLWFRAPFCQGCEWSCWWRAAVCGCNLLFLYAVLHISVDFHYSEAQNGQWVSRRLSGLSAIEKVSPVHLSTLPVLLLLHESGLRQQPFAVMLDIYLLQSSQMQNVKPQISRDQSVCWRCTIWGHLTFGLCWIMGRLLH